jgi:hypothetical protein
MHIGYKVYFLNLIYSKVKYTEDAAYKHEGLSEESILSIT